MKLLLLFFFVVSLGSARGEYFKEVFTSGGHTFHAEGMSNFKYPVLTIDDENLLLITHASKYWDSQGLTWNGISPLINLFNSKGWPLKYLISVHERVIITGDKDPQRFLPKGIDSEDHHPFQGDSHRIVFRGKNLVLTGGNFTICACNAARSLIALSEPSDRLNVFFVLDGIYEGQKGVTRTLSQIAQEYDDRNFLKYLKDDFFNRDGLPCKEATLFSITKKFKFFIYRHEKLIGQYGSGENAVNLFFTNSSKIPSKISF